MSLIVAGIDIETTGLSQEKGHRIIEVSMDTYSTDDGINFYRTEPVWTIRSNPLRSIDPGAEAVHKISLHDLRGELEWEDVARKLSEKMEAVDLVVAHNGDGFDLPFIALELIRVGLEVPDIEHFDTMLHGRQATGMGKVPSLQELCFAFEEEYDVDAAHAADYDTIQTMMCFIKGCKWGVFYPSVFDILKTEKAA